MPLCQSCNQHAETLMPCTWDARLEVGSCCEFNWEECDPEDNRCEDEVKIFLAAKTIRQCVEQVAKHRRECPRCIGLQEPKLPARNLQVVEMPRKGSAAPRTDLGLEKAA
jgi:hypothetical protein